MSASSGLALARQSFDPASCDPRGGDAYCRVVAVEYSPDQRFAVVFLEYSPDSRPTPEEVLCERSDAGWTSSISGSGGGIGWMITHEDPKLGERGVTTRWSRGQSPRAEWDTPPPL